MLFAFLFILSIPQEGYTVDPYRVFAQSDSILSGINAVEYSFSFSGTGALSNIIPELEGTTCLGFQSGIDHPLMNHSIEYILSEGTIRNIRAPSSFVATEDSVYFIDNTRNEAYRAEYSLSSHDMFDFPPSSLMMEYVVSNPFMDEMLADSIVILFPVDRSGITCHVFHVYYADHRGSEAVWFISMEDLMPRAVERIGYYGSASLPGGQLLEISNLNTGCDMPLSPIVPYTFTPWLSLLAPSTQAPEFFLSGMDGFTRRSSDFHDKALLLCFFSSWDPSSMSALGVLKRITAEYPELVQAVGISILESNDPWFRLNSLDIDFPILVYGEDAAEDFNVHSVPAVFLISNDGKILLSSMSMADSTESEISRLILIEKGM